MSFATMWQAAIQALNAMTPQVDSKRLGMALLVTPDANGAPEAIGATNGGLDSYEVDKPQGWFLAVDSTAADTTNGGTVYEILDARAYNHFEFSVVAGTGADDLSIVVSHDGTNYEATGLQVVDRSLVVGAVVQSVADFKAAGNYVLEGRFYSVKILQNGATISAAYHIRGSHSIA